MSQDAPATFTQTLAAWSFPSGGDISGHGRHLVPVGIAAGTLDNITAGVFAATSHARMTPGVTWLSVPDLSVEFLIRPTIMTTTGIILRVGPPDSNVGPAIVLRIAFITATSTFVWGMTRRGTQGAEANAIQVSDAAVGPTFDTTYHCVFVIGNNQFNQIFINGEALTLTHANSVVGGGALPVAALTENIPIPTGYELTIGDPSTTQNTFLGTLGRVIVYPYAVTPGQAQASARLQLDQDLTVGMGADEPLATSTMARWRCRSLGARSPTQMASSSSTSTWLRRHSMPTAARSWRGCRTRRRRAAARSSGAMCATCPMTAPAGIRTCRSGSVRTPAPSRATASLGSSFPAASGGGP